MRDPDFKPPRFVTIPYKTNNGANVFGLRSDNDRLPVAGANYEDIDYVLASEYYQIQRDYQSALHRIEHLRSLLERPANA